MFKVVKEDTVNLKCNAEKNRSRINHKTAGRCSLNGILNYDFGLGILLGAWPCGTIVMIEELFGTESKAQVYGQLHSLLSTNTHAMSNLG